MQTVSVWAGPAVSVPPAPPRKPVRAAMLVSGETVPGWAAALAVKLSSVSWASPLICNAPSQVPVKRVRRLPGDAGKEVPLRLVPGVRTPMRHANADLLLLIHGDAANAQQMAPAYPAGLWWCERMQTNWMQSCRLRVLMPGRREAFTAFESHTRPGDAAAWAQNLILERQLHLLYEHGLRTLRPYRSPLPPPQQTVSAAGAADVRHSAPAAFEYEGRWWRFECVETPLFGVASRDLHLFYASDPAGEWTPHPLNPVLSDARCAVTTGNVYEREGTLYRPALAGPQRIVRLTEEEYEEEPA